MTRTTDFDRLSTSAPMNRAAALARDGGGTHFTPRAGKVNSARWAAPPEMRPVPADMHDFTGRVFDRFTVIGLSAMTGKTGPRWVLRCTCGYYENRRNRLLVEGTGRAITMCSECDYLEELKAGRVPPPPQLVAR